MICDLLDSCIVISDSSGSERILAIKEEEVLAALPLSDMCVDLIEHDEGEESHRKYKATGLIYVSVKADGYDGKITLAIVSFLNNGLLWHLPLPAELDEGVHIYSDYCDHVRLTQADDAFIL